MLKINELPRHQSSQQLAPFARLGPPSRPNAARNLMTKDGLNSHDAARVLGDEPPDDVPRLQAVRDRDGLVRTN